MISARDFEISPPQEVPGLVAEGEAEFPPLVPPTAKPIAPTSIHTLSVKELLKSITQPKIPETTMTGAEWDTYLALQGWSEEDIDNRVMVETEQLVAEAQNRKNMVEAFLAQGPLLPEQTMTDILKKAVINPPLVVLEGLNIYYEHVSMPAAGWLYGKAIPDIQKAYIDFRAQNPSATDREAYVYAWKKWDAPGPPVVDFILKYMLMEAIVDPITLVGWGIATKFLRTLGPVGRTLAKANMIAAEGLELPFDGIKWVARNLPKSVSGRAAAMARESVKILDRYFELAIVPGKVQPLTWIKPRDMRKAGEDALEHLARSPRAEDDIAKAAQEMLVHPPVSKEEAINWVQRLRATGVQTLEPNDITNNVLLDIDRIFERVFTKEITANEAAPLLMHRLGISGVAETTSALSTRLLADRNALIVVRALDFTFEESANKAMQAYGKKAGRIFEEVARADLVNKAGRAGRVNALLLNLEKTQLASWATWVDRMVVRTAAESYLTFGLYGPMNVLEDIWRSALGGVRPGRMTVERWDVQTAGLLSDPSLRIAGVSEKYGPLRDLGEPQRTNWMLTMSLLPLSAPTWALSGGRITPAAFSRGTFRNLVERYGAIGMEMRRNFTGGRMNQILAEKGGAAYTALDNAVPKDLPSALASAPKWVRRNLQKDLHAASVTGKLTTDNTVLVDGLKSNYTRDTIRRVEVDDIIKKYPDVSPTTRSLVFAGHKEFMKSPEAIDDFMRTTVMGAEVDDFLKGPERATVQYEELTNLLTSLEVTNPADMAELITSLHRMTATYGALPDQIMARATIKSRGLPFANRQLQFDTEFDRLHTFMDKAGAEVDKVIEFVKSKPVGDVGYQDATRRYLDLATSTRKLISESKLQDTAFRNAYFAQGVPKGVEREAFWNSFYASENAFWKDTSKKMARLNAQLVQATNDINVAAGLKMPVRPAVIVQGRPLAPADVAKLMGTRGDDVSRMLLDTLIPEGDKDYFTEYVLGLVKEGQDVGFDRASIEAVYDQIANSILVDPSSSSWFRARQMEIESMTRDFHDLYNMKLFPDEQKRAVDGFIDETARSVDEAISREGIVAGDYDILRQESLDESTKWYFKEYTDYTNANAVDDLMKKLYPFWTYESQRWFWLPRSFMRRPGTLAAQGRWQNNTEYGYIHIPGTAIDVNPARGTIYGPWTTRLMRKDYPEYYDQLEGAGGLVGFFDFLSRYGFYPNVIYGTLLAQFGGAQPQTGGILPAAASTPLNAMIAAFPDSKLVEFISDRVFPEPFRKYLTSRRVDDLGGDGSLLFAKRQTGETLTPEEEALWADARGYVALHSSLFEQFGMFRMRSDESYAVGKAAEAFIEENWGYTPEQQRQARLRGVKLWDEIGGLDPWETKVLQELEAFKYSGSINPVLPSAKQATLNRIEIAWAAVRTRAEQRDAEILDLSVDFLQGSERGRLGPKDFLNRVRELQSDLRDFVDSKMKEVPEMELEYRVQQFAKYGDVMPVQSPYNELMALYFSIELEDTVNELGERVLDWDKFWASREFITQSIPEDDRPKWDAFLSKTTAPVMKVWKEVSETYFRKYYDIWEQTLSAYPEEEQQLIKEFLFLSKTQQQLERQEAIKSIISTKNNLALISGFRSDVSKDRTALRFANPHLDAWLFYWGRTTSFQTPQAETVYKQLAARTGRKIE